MSLAKNIVPSMVKDSVADLATLKKDPFNKHSLLSSLEGLQCFLENEVSIEEASSIPLNIFSDHKMMTQSMRSKIKSQK